MEGGSLWSNFAQRSICSSRLNFRGRETTAIGQQLRITLSSGNDRGVQIWPSELSRPSRCPSWTSRLSSLPRKRFAILDCRSIRQNPSAIDQSKSFRPYVEETLDTRSERSRLCNYVTTSATLTASNLSSICYSIPKNRPNRHSGSIITSTMIEHSRACQNENFCSRNGAFQGIKILSASETSLSSIVESFSTLVSLSKRILDSLAQTTTRRQKSAKRRKDPGRNFSLVSRENCQEILSRRIDHLARSQRRVWRKERAFSNPVLPGETFGIDRGGDIARSVRTSEPGCGGATKMAGGQGSRG